MGFIRDLFTRPAAETGRPYDELELALESLADVELAQDDEGWQRLSAQIEAEMTRDGLLRASRLCRVMTIVNPLMRRALQVRTAYVWGQGVGVQARATDKTGAQDVNAVIQRFVDDPSNRETFTGSQAHHDLESGLWNDGAVFTALFTNPRNGRVQVRVLPYDEITDVVCNPEDEDEPWLYKRVWTHSALDPRTGQTITEPRETWYPALNYRPAARMRQVNGAPVRWDAPVHRTRVNRLAHKQFGIGDGYAAINWARGYKEFLEDWAQLTKALSRFAFKASSSKNPSQKLRAKLQQQQQIAGGSQAGATAYTSPDSTLEAVPKTGATIDSDSGRPLAAMVASAVGLPVTTLLSDPGVTGARATAETLNQPMRLELQSRQELWTETYRAIFAYVIEQAVRASDGMLDGTITRDPYDGHMAVELVGNVDATVDITWPDLEEVPVETIVKAVVEADGTEKMPPLETVRLLLRALKVRDVDEIVDQMTDDDGNFIPPDVTAGDVAARAYRNGQSPGAAIYGQQTSDEGGE